MPKRFFVSEITNTKGKLHVKKLRWGRLNSRLLQCGQDYYKREERLNSTSRKAGGFLSAGVS